LYTLLRSLKFLWLRGRVILLPSGKFPRFAVAGALLFALLLLLDLEFVRSAYTNLLVSNSLDVAMVLLAACCCFYASRRSFGYPRQLWLLLTVAFTLETMAQAISTYYQTFVPGSAASPWPSDVLFFLWAAPVFMILLPRSDEDSAGIDSVRLLDFLQVAILAATLYLYFFYSPSRWRANQPALLRQILLVYIARDIILSVAFFFRSRASIPSWLRSFCLVLAAVFLFLVLAEGEYLFALVDTRLSPTWGDLIWMVPSFIIILIAGKWKQPAPSPVSSSPSRIGSLVGSQVLPIAMPLLVILMGRAIAREQVLLAWLVVAASVTCSSVRLILTNRKQRRISENLLNAEKALRSSEQVLSTAFRNSPDAFSINPFPNGPYFEVNDGFTRLTGYPRDEVIGKTPRQMNLWVVPEERDFVLASLIKAGEARDVEFRFRTKDGRVRVGQMNASLIDINGQRCTLVVVRDMTERKEAEEILRSSEERFRSLVRDLHFAVVLHSPEARIEFANRAAHSMFGLPDGVAIGKFLPELGISTVDEDGNDVPQSERPVINVLRTRQPINDALIGFRHPGSDNILWTFGNIVPQFDSSGNIIRLISSFADVTRMRNAERAIHQLSTQLLKLQDEERRRLGRELHDGLAQTVLAINLSLAQVRQSLTSQEDAAATSLERARTLTQQMSREIRTLSYLLHPPLLDDLGLVSALKEYAHGFTERSGIRTQLHANAKFDRLPQAFELALFRIVQESLANIQRHSGSPSAEIHLSQEDRQVALEVTDFGCGITLSSGRNPQPQDAHLGVGIPGMRERISQLGGHFNLISGPTGTTVRATITLPAPAQTEMVDGSPSHSDRG
jgi:PAS domain S-box-containing protein